jgi:hypothetical protein
LAHRLDERRLVQSIVVVVEEAVAETLDLASEARLWTQR